MLIANKILKSIFIAGEGYLYFDSASLLVYESNGLKEWNVEIEGAENKLTEVLIRTSDSLNVQLTAEDLNEYSGQVLVINKNELKGTGRLYGFQ